MRLSELKIRKAKPKKQQYKLYDEGGLLLAVRPTGGKFWRLKYRYGGTEQSLSLGQYVKSLPIATPVSLPIMTPPG